MYDFTVKERRQRKRLFHRLVTGFWWHRKELVRFLTLTSVPDSPEIRESWKEFVKRVRRNYGKFEYFVVFTDEGYGVIHCVFIGEYLPFRWVQDTWEDIHGAFQVNIKAVDSFDKSRTKRIFKRWKGKHGDQIYYPIGLAAYVLNQYLGDQDKLRTINFSRGWVYPGFVKDWERFKRQNKDKSKRVAGWHKFLDGMKIKQIDLYYWQ